MLEKDNKKNLESSNAVTNYHRNKGYFKFNAQIPCVFLINTPSLRLDQSVRDISFAQRLPFKTQMKGEYLKEQIVHS